MSPPWCLGFLAGRHCGSHRLCLLVEPSGSGQALKDTGETGLEERSVELRIVSQLFLYLGGFGHWVSSPPSAPGQHPPQGKP